MDRRRRQRPHVHDRGPALERKCSGDHCPAACRRAVASPRCCDAQCRQRGRAAHQASHHGGRRRSRLCAARHGRGPHPARLRGHHRPALGGVGAVRRSFRRVVRRPGGCQPGLPHGWQEPAQGPPSTPRSGGHRCARTVVVRPRVTPQHLGLPRVQHPDLLRPDVPAGHSFHRDARAVAADERRGVHGLRSDAHAGLAGGPARARTRQRQSRELVLGARCGLLGAAPDGDLPRVAVDGVHLPGHGAGAAAPDP